MPSCVISRFADDDDAPRGAAAGKAAAAAAATQGAGSGDAARNGMAQADQKAAVEAFSRGDFDVLVATCIAEEGLDIGEVDLIVNYDSQKSPIRMIQRMGRYAAHDFTPLSL
jgi:ERCC4-related helicase